MKKFKHKTIWWIAERSESNWWDYVIANTLDVSWLPKELIENSQDREEVIEKDWIWKAFDEFWNNETEFRQAIEKHAPKLKFTINDISNYTNLRNSPYWTVEYVAIRDFLKDNNLLSSDE